MVGSCLEVVADDSCSEVDSEDANINQQKGKTTETSSYLQQTPCDSDSDKDSLLLFPDDLLLTPSTFVINRASQIISLTFSHLNPSDDPRIKTSF